jgi:hypothetical protein
VPMKRNHDETDILLATYDEADVNPFKTPVFQMVEMQMPLPNLTSRNSKQSHVACEAFVVEQSKIDHIMWNMEPVDPGTRGTVSCFLFFIQLLCSSEALQHCMKDEGKGLLANDISQGKESASHVIRLLERARVRR